MWAWARKDIECYKVLDTYSGNAFWTPYKRERVPDDAIKGKKCFRAQGKLEMREICYPGSQLYEVEGGVIHAFVDREGAIKIARSFMGVVSIDIESIPSIFKCIIPRGTRYIMGIESEGQICAKRIKFVEKVSYSIKDANAEWIES